MCGIVGVIGPNSVAFTPNFAKAIETLAHRGPDGEGSYADGLVLLGHRRLSIIDLSQLGAQPMIDPTGCVITYNGELYNYLELKRELLNAGHEFISSSDTEVIIKSYLQWGSECVKRFNGMWAFCLWDPRRKVALLSRDHFGIKPLYTATLGGCVLFASEPKALLALAPQLTAVDTEAVARFIGMGELYSSGRSFYENISIFPSASNAEVYAECPRSAPGTYWRLSCDHRGIGELDQNEFDELFEDAVRIRLRSDVPVGLTLSGGIDSTCILAAMAKFTKAGATCLTAAYGPDAGGEQGWAALAAAKCDSRLIAVIAPGEQWLETLPRIAWHLDGPGYSPAVFPTWKIMEAARAHEVPVLLEGQGADEAFGGYPHYGAISLATALRAARIGESAVIARELAQSFGLKLVLGWMLRYTMPRLFSFYRESRGGLSILNDQLRSLLPSVETAPELDNLRDGMLTAKLASDFTRDVLPSLLQYGDAISMAHSIESRLPFLDVRLIESIFSAGDQAKIRSGITKPILRNYLRRMSLAVIADRKDKLGYPTPLNTWLMRDSSRAIKKLLLSDESRILRYCSPDAIRSAIGRLGHDSIAVSHLLYKLISLEVWLRGRFG